MIKILLLAVVPFITQHRNVAPKTEVSTNFYGSVTGIVDKAYIEARVGAGGGGCDTNAVDALANSAVVTNALTVATTNRVALLESSKADNTALTAHVTNTNNPHAVTAEQVGAVPFVEDTNGEKTAVTIGSRKDVQFGGSVGYSSFAKGFNVDASGVFSHAEGQDTSSPGFCSHSEGCQTTASGKYSHTEGSGTRSDGDGSHAEGDNTFAFANYSHVAGRLAQTLKGHDHAYVWNGDETRSEPYISHDRGTFNINPKNGLNGFYIGEQTLYAILANKADKAALEGKVSWDSDHLGVALGDGYLSAGPYSSLGSDSRIGSNATINDNALIGNTSGGSTFIGGWLHFSPERKLFSPALFTMGDQLIYTTDFGNSVMLYFPSKSGTIATTDDITNSISETNTVFSNAVLAVGLNIDTNSVAVLNEIAENFGGFPLGAGETATTVGGLLAALAAAVAWLKKNKVQTLKLNDNSVETSANGGVAKLDGFFTESNSLLTATIDARLPYPLYAVPSTGILKDRAINTTSLASVTVPDNFTDLLVRASVASSLAVTMPESIATKYGDTFPGEAGEYLITITKTGAAEAYVRTIKLEEVA